MVDLNRELAKRRVFVFFALALLFATLLTVAIDENTIANHAADDIGIAVVALAMLAYILYNKSRTKVNELLKQNNAIALLVVLAIIVKIIGIYIERGTVDFGDEIPVLITLVMMLANRFL